MAKWTREYQLQYMREYNRTHKRKLTPEQREKQNARQRERYANNAEYKARMQAKAQEWNESHPLNTQKGCWTSTKGRRHIGLIY